MACKERLRDFELDDTAQGTILAEVLSSLLAAAEYLSSAAIYGRFLERDEEGEQAASLIEKSTHEGILIDAAIATLTKRGALAAVEPNPEATSEEVCAEALALASYLNIDSVSTSELAKGEVVPPQLIDTVLVEGLRLREDFRELRNHADGDSHSLRNSQNVLGGILVAFGLVAGWATSSAISGVLGETVAPLLAAAVAIGALGWVLTFLGACPPWLIKVFEVAQEGTKGILGVFSSRLNNAARRSDGTGVGDHDHADPLRTAVQPAKPESGSPSDH